MVVSVNNINSLKDSELLLSREIGLVKFYHRVLAQALDASIPLLERLNYLCIVCKNCDELFEVRVARLLKWNQTEPNKVFDDGKTAKQSLALVRDAVMGLYDEVYHTYHKILIPELAKEKIHIVDSSKWDLAIQNFVHNYFIHELKPVLTPIGIDPTHPFPRVPNKNLHIAVELSGKDQFGRDSRIAIVEAPRILPRIIKLPRTVSNNEHSFILLQDIIKLHVDKFFNGLQVLGCYPFRVTRAADLTLRHNTKNIRQALTQEIHNRKYAQCSRLELDISNGAPSDTLISILLTQFNISRQDLYLADGPVNLSRLMDLIPMIDRPELKFPAFIPGIPQEIKKQPNIFKAMAQGDILIHTPYQSFDPVFQLTKMAAEDDSVLAIKMTVYRAGANSQLINHLIKAAQRGKQVVASIELFARFDEETNVELATQLEDAGAHVVYGVMGYKVHSKMLMVVRKEGNAIKQYVHLGTGNYNQTSAMSYTDFSLLTTNRDIANDVDNIFAQITGVGKIGMLHLLHQSPFTLHEMLIKSIETETRVALDGGMGLIIAKMNSLVEPYIIKSLYAASQAGVKINLLVRGACALRPNVKGLSENITVYSIVGRFLEHSRVFYFYNSGAEDLYISSADWMQRNFFMRVETCVPILDPKIKKRIIEEGLMLYLRDNLNAWKMDSNGEYKRLTGRGRKISAQLNLMNKYGETERSSRT